MADRHDAAEDGGAMTVTMIIIIGVAVAILLAVGFSRGGPRVTRIDRTVRREEDSHDA
jgi:hypothetical protein